MHGRTAFAAESRPRLSSRRAIGASCARAISRLSVHSHAKSPCAERSSGFQLGTDPGVGNAKYEGIVQTVDAKCFPLRDETSVRKWFHA